MLMRFEVETQATDGRERTVLELDSERRGAGIITVETTQLNRETMGKESLTGKKKI